MDEFDPKVAEDDRRAFLSKFGKVALVAPPAISMLLSTSMSSPAIARSTGGPPPSDPLKGNNGVGNGYDPPPPGNPKENDGPGASPGNPGNSGGNNNSNSNKNKDRSETVHGHGHGHS